MKKHFLTFLLSLSSLSIFAQQNYFQQHLNYNIDVILNDKDKTLTGKETIVYKNNSPSTLDFIWFHIWPNAYKNENTALFKQIRNDESRKKKLADVSYGSIDGLNFKVDGKTAATEAHPEHIDIIKVLLPKPLKSGDSITIATDFNVKLPSYFSRSGYADKQFMVTQWYPKPAVFDKDGWHAFPYLDMGEFYSEYGNYKVNITLPQSYIVGATGVLQNADELEVYKSLGAKNTTTRGNKPALYVPKNPTGTKTLAYAAQNVPDFAWFADQDLVIQYDTVKLGSGKVIDAFSYYHNKKNTLWVNSIDYIKDATKKYSAWIGEYEYPTVQAIEGPKNNSSGGMEYPTITLITSPDAKKETLDGVITHEVGHNWFMSMLGNNERMHTWQDEGFNTFYQFRYEAEKYKSNSMFGADNIPAQVKALPTDKFLASIYGAMFNIPMESAIETPAADFKTSEEYGLISYGKTALWLYILESQVGKEKFDKAFQDYFAGWKNKHPTPADFKASFEKSLGVNLDQYFELLNKKGKFE